MKRISAVLALLYCFCGCSSQNQDMERAVALRQRILSASECRFDTEITADYGDKRYTFSMECSADKQGNIRFAVTAPESLAGISGGVSDTGGELTFDDIALSFPLLSEEQLSPVSAPWIFMKTLRSGYLTAVGKEAELLRVTIDDSYQEDAMQLDIWINDEDQPIKVDILHNGSRILSLKIINFQIL